MLAFDTVYEFKIVYFRGKEKKVKYIFSDSDDITKLDNVPKTTTMMTCKKSSPDGTKFDAIEDYVVGEKLSQPVLKDLIDEVCELKVSKEEEPKRKVLLDTLKHIYKKSAEFNEVLVNENIEDYFTEDEGRIRIRQLYLPTTPIVISPKCIVNGKILPKQRVNKGKDVDDASYINLE